MRIAMLVDSFLPVSETFIQRQITGLLKRGEDVDIFALARAEASDVNRDAVRMLGERVRYLRGPRQLSRRALTALRLAGSMAWRHPLVFTRTLNVFKYRRAALSLDLLHAAAGLIVAGGRYDIVHCQFGHLGLVALQLQRVGALTGKLVTSFRGNDSTGFLRAHPDGYKELFSSGDLFCPVSESLKQRIIAAGCPVERIRVLHSGVDCARLKYSPRRRNPGETTRLLTVSRLVEKKGVAYAIQAVARLVRMGRRVSYTIAGDGPLRASLARLITDAGLSDHVRMLGWVTEEQVALLLQESHIFVAPSVTADGGDQEGIPNVLKEAMATGLPVVSTWHGGVPELVEDGISGFLVPERDVEALSDRLTYLVDHAEVWLEMSRAGRLKVEEEFEIENLNDRLVELYRGLVKDKDPAHGEDRGLARVGQGQ